MKKIFKNLLLSGILITIAVAGTADFPREDAVGCLTNVVVCLEAYKTDYNVHPSSIDKLYEAYIGRKTENPIPESFLNRLEYEAVVGKGKKNITGYNLTYRNINGDIKIHNGKSQTKGINIDVEAIAEKRREDGEALKEVCKHSIHNKRR